MLWRLTVRATVASEEDPPLPDFITGLTFADLLPYIAIGFTAQLVDGALGTAGREVPASDGSAPAAPESRS